MTGRVNNELIIEQEAAKASYFYEKTLYKLIVKRKNPYLEQKKLLLEPNFKNNAARRLMNNFNDKKFDPETSSMRSQPSVNYNYSLNYQV